MLLAYGNSEADTVADSEADTDADSEVDTDADSDAKEVAVPVLVAV